MRFSMEAVPHNFHLPFLFLGSFGTFSLTSRHAAGDSHFLPPRSSHCTPKSRRMEGSLHFFPPHLSIDRLNFSMLTPPPRHPPPAPIYAQTNYTFFFSSPPSRVRHIHRVRLPASTGIRTPPAFSPDSLNPRAILASFCFSRTFVPFPFNLMRISPKMRRVPLRPGVLPQLFSPNLSLRDRLPPQIRIHHFFCLSFFFGDPSVLSPSLLVWHAAHPLPSSPTSFRFPDLSRFVPQRR